MRTVLATIPADQILVVVGGCAQEDLSSDDRSVRLLRVRHNSYDYTALIGWLAYLRRSPEVREVLAVTEDGTPDTTEILVTHSDSEARPQ